MEPAFQRGDLLFLWNRNLEMNHIVGPPTAASAEFPGTQVGEVVVYNVVGKDIPIVHRVVRRHKGAFVTPAPYGHGRFCRMLMMPRIAKRRLTFSPRATTTTPTTRNCMLGTNTT